jgi:S-disulfanyl-L-cysteine oxidoreductase SoxD
LLLVCGIQPGSGQFRVSRNGWRHNFKRRIAMSFRVSTLLAALAGAMLFLPAASSLAQDEALPKASFTAAQVERGAAEYKRSCLDCHGANLDDGEFGGAPLKGAGFREKYFGITADALFGYISTAMPPDRPGRLSPGVYADLTAFILSKNGMTAGSSELPSDLDALSQLMVE